MTDHIELDAATAAWLQAARNATAEIARLTEVRDVAIQHVKDALGECAEARVGGKPVVTWAYSKPAEYIDKKGLEAAHPAIAAMFTRLKSPARPFRLLDGE